MNIPLRESIYYYHDKENGCWYMKNQSPADDTEPKLPEGVTINVHDYMYDGKVYMWASANTAWLRMVADHIDWRERQQQREAEKPEVTDAMIDAALRAEHHAGSGPLFNDVQRVRRAIQAALNAQKETK